MIVYSLLLTLALVVSAPWWLWRMATSGRYRAGLSGRLGIVPAGLDETIARRGASAGLIWLHAVSVGEVLAAQRLVTELQTALPGYQIVVSTTTETGQNIAREKLGGVPVFYYPLDFAFAVRRYLRVLKPTLFVTVESEFWPRMIIECERARVPVAVVNARISDRSFPRYMRLRKLWQPLLAKVSIFLAQGEETAERLRGLGVSPAHIQVSGNLKHDTLLPASTPLVTRLQPMLAGRPVVLAGSTLAGEEELLLDAWSASRARYSNAILLLAPRHQQRFGEVANLIGTYQYPATPLHAIDSNFEDGEVLLLNTLGDLASLYQLATIAFVGGSLVRKGGHNPLEPARFGVPVLMGPSYENFREIVEPMLAQDAIRITEAELLAMAMISLLEDDQGIGQRGRDYFESQSGATARTVQQLCELIR